MQTLTITEAKKNLGRLLKQAAQGEQIGIVSGADIIALRKVEVEAADYGQSEYGVDAKQLQQVERTMDRRYREMTVQKKIKITTHQELKNLLEKASRS